MKCRDASEMMNSYFDNKIDPMKDRILAEHIQSCNKCRAELDFLNKYRTILKSVKPVPPPDNYLTVLHRKIELERAENPLKKFIGTLRNFSDTMRFPLEAAGVLAAAVIIFFLYKPFFSEKIQTTADEYGIESPRSEIPSKQDKLKDPEKSDRIMISKNLLPGNNETAPIMHIREKNIPDINPADDNLSKSRESDFDSASVNEMKKSPSVESEKSFMRSEEKSYSAESIDVKGAALKRKDSGDSPYSDVEKLFVEFEVYVISKDLADSSKLFYKIRVHSARHASLIKKLKENYIVIEKNPNRTKPDYEIELFLKKNKK